MGARSYQGARWYNPANGRFNRLDPFFGNLTDPQSLHKYLYVHGDPIQGVDPLGLFSLGGIQISMSIQANLQGLKAESDFGVLNGFHVRSENEFASAMFWQVALGALPFLGIFGKHIGKFASGTGSVLRRIIEYGFAGLRHVMERVPFLKYIYSELIEFLPKAVTKGWNFSQKVMDDYLANAKTIMLGRFARNAPLEDFAARVKPDATILSKQLGAGKWLVENIQTLIKNADTIYLRAADALDPKSFTFKHEIGLIKTDANLMRKTKVLVETGRGVSEVPFFDWALKHNLL